MIRSPAPRAFDAAAATRWDVVVVGAGPAGGSAAVRLARRGLRVLLIDRGEMPRGKLCGCCLSPAAVRELEQLVGTATGPLARVVPLRRIRLAAGGRTARIDVAGGGTLSREALDAELVTAAVAAGCGWLPRTTAVATADGTADGEPLVVLSVREADSAQRVDLECRRLILATGLGAAVRQPAQPAGVMPRLVAANSRIGVGTVLPATAATLPPGELVMAVAAQGYCGIVRLEDGRIDVAAAVDRRELASASAAAVVRRIVAAACGGESDPRGGCDLRLHGLEQAEFRGTPPLTHAAPLVAGHGGAALRIGDAAGYVEPFTGEGMGWALAAGRLAAEALVDADGGLVPAAVAADRYERSHARHFGPRYARCRRVAAAARRPWLVGWAVRAAQLAPCAARLVVPAVTGAGAGAADRAAARLPAGAVA